MLFFRPRIFIFRFVFVCIGKQVTMELLGIEVVDL